jgi:probable F420-dependent oxidoreductase
MTDLGLITFVTDYTLQPVELARAVEERGIESLFLTEHTHIPTSRESPSYLGGDLPQEYWHTHDVFTALAAAAAVTETLILGTGICLVPEHHPLTLAKQVASLDSLSKGRFIFGIGAGWNAEELANHGVAFKDRWKVTRESVLAMREVWTQDEAEYHGEFIDFDPVWSWPKPAQAGGPPVLLGAGTKWSWDRVAEYCDGWYPIDGHDDLAEGIEGIKAAFDRRDRPWEDIQLTAGTLPDEARIRELAELGFSRVTVQLPSIAPDQQLPILDEYAKLAERLR